MYNVEVNFIHYNLNKYHCSAAWLSETGFDFNVVDLTPVEGFMAVLFVVVVGVERDDAVLGLEVTTRGLTKKKKKKKKKKKSKINIYNI